MLKGTPISILDLSKLAITDSNNSINLLLNNEQTALIIRDVFPQELLARACGRLCSESMNELIGSPNRGMLGGELRTLGEAATPTFQALNGPSKTDYLLSAQRAQEWQSMMFDDVNMIGHLSEVLSVLNQHKPVYPAPLKSNPQETWLPFNYRILPPGTQIYSHHDCHYRLPIYSELHERYDRDTLLSWFLTAQTPSEGGCLTIYGLRSDDPNPPMLPTRFVDTEVLEREYHKIEFHLGVGDLVIFNSHQYVHRVTPVIGERSRITFGGFMTSDIDRSHAVFWS